MVGYYLKQYYDRSLLLHWSQEVLDRLRTNKDLSVLHIPALTDMVQSLVVVGKCFRTITKESKLMLCTLKSIMYTNNFLLLNIMF